MKNSIKRAGVLTIATAAMALAIGAQAMASSAATVTLQGDANADAAFGVADAVLFSKYLANADTLTEQGAANSDMNSDSMLNAIDLTLMKRQLLNPTVEPTGDNWVTAITYAESSVTLKDANGAVIAAADATNVTVANNTMVTITQPGEYDVDGNCSNGQLNINCDKTNYALGQVTCNLLGLNLSNSSDSPIYVTAIDDEFVLTVKNGYTNTISDGTSYTNADAGVGAIYSCDDMKIKGKGTLIVKGNCEDGIVCKNDLKIWNGDIQVTAVDDGIRGKDSVRIGDPDDIDYSALKVSVTASGDGIKSTDESDTTCGFVRVTGGAVTVNSVGDAITGVYNVEINGGTLDLTTTGNSSQVGSSKGLKAGWTDDTTGTAYTGNVTVAGGYITIDSTDDCLHASGDITVTGVAGGTVGGTTPILNLTSGDDGIHADNIVTIGNGSANTYNDLTININDGYEGIEGYYIYQNSGTIICYVADDIYNAAGGADGSGNTNQGGWGGGGWGGGSGSVGYLYLNGGFVWGFNYEGDSDGMDSNGDLYMNGGIYITNGSDPIDKGDNASFTYTGGTFIHGQGNAMMENAASEISNLYSSSSNINSGTVTFTDGNGNVIAHFTAIGNQMKSVAIAGSTIDANVKMYTGATVSGGTLLGNGLADSRTCYVDGTVSGGTQVTLTAGSSSGNGNNPWGW